MSLARFGCDGSDVYVFYDVGDFINCCGCHFHANTEQEMIDHLHEHQKDGHHVPQYVFDELYETAQQPR